eukprot:TRINITY_DN3353_c0_g1_i3.p1 TRINITY_DN3353_c0_g1~~TRINITY_DN3353_c0_g1_i3.p1  ORF type:complete len:122 (+),score=12.28 TRINITY_DN3353_c0_g1_i3:243-608(+)
MATRLLLAAAVETVSTPLASNSSTAAGGVQAEGFVTCGHLCATDGDCELGNGDSKCTRCVDGTCLSPDAHVAATPEEARYSLRGRALTGWDWHYNCGSYCFAEHECHGGSCGRCVQGSCSG